MIISSIKSSSPLPAHEEPDYGGRGSCASRVTDHDDATSDPPDPPLKAGTLLLKFGVVVDVDTFDINYPDEALNDHIIEKLTTTYIFRCDGYVTARNNIFALARRLRLHAKARELDGAIELQPNTGRHAHRRSRWQRPSPKHATNARSGQAAWVPCAEPPPEARSRHRQLRRSCRWSPPSSLESPAPSGGIAGTPQTPPCRRASASAQNRSAEASFAQKAAEEDISRSRSRRSSSNRSKSSRADASRAPSASPGLCGHSADRSPCPPLALPADVTPIGASRDVSIKSRTDARRRPREHTRQDRRRLGLHLRHRLHSPGSAGPVRDKRPRRQDPRSRQPRRRCPPPGVAVNAQAPPPARRLRDDNAWLSHFMFKIG